MGAFSSYTAKICLTVIGLIFWGAAAALIFLGAWVFHTYNHFSELTTANITLIPATILIVVGVFLFLLGCIGCIGAYKENKCILATFFCLLLVILTAEIIAAALGYYFRKTMNNSVHDGLTDALNQYDGNSTTWTDQVDYVQRELKCCGINNASDWSNAKIWRLNHTATQVPQSCCRPLDSKHNCTATLTSKDIYTKGCLRDLQDKFNSNLVYIASVAGAFAVIQLLGMICSCILFCRSKEVRYEMLGGPNSGLRV